ncbi:MAG: DegV family protein [Dehalococcoidia bacterium]|nr:DegV family protein [Dehalococcoidia bacterium]
MAIRIVTDSTCDLPLELTQQLGIEVVPCNVHFGTEVYRDGLELTTDEFFRRLAASKRLPTTSQPSVGVLLDTYRRAAEDGADVVSIHVSERLSGTLESARLARASHPTPDRIHLVDSKQASIGLGLVVLEAVERAQGGASAAEVVAAAEGAATRARIFAVLDTLEYLQRGGRIGRAQAFLGGVLKVKPMITIEGGEVHPLERPRSTAKAVERLLARVAALGALRRLGVTHSTVPEVADTLAQRLAPVVASGRLVRGRFGPVLGVHVGPGAFGVAVLPETPLATSP